MRTNLSLLATVFAAASAWLGPAGPAAAQSSAPVYSWTTLAGRASAGHNDGSLTQARFNHPTGLAIDSTGNVYLADTGNHVLRKLSPAGVVTTLAGAPGLSGFQDGSGSAARFNGPQGVAVDAAGNVYVSDTGNHVIRQISPTGVVTTIAGQAGKDGTADGAATTALLSAPGSIAVDPAGAVYVLDHGIRKISGGTVQTVYAGGPFVYGGASTAVENLAGLAIGPGGQVFFSARLASGPRGIFSLDANGTPSLVLSSDTTPWTVSSNPDQYSARTSVTAFGALSVDATGNFHVATYSEVGYPPCSIYTFNSAGLWLASATIGSGDDAASMGTTGLYATSIPSLASDSAGNVVFTRVILGNTQSDNVVARLAPAGSVSVLAGTPQATGGVDGVGSGARFSSLGEIYVDANDTVWAGDTWLYQGDSTVQVDHGVALRRISASGSVTTPVIPPWPEDQNWQSWGIAGDSAGNILFGIHWDYLYRITALAPGSLTPMPWFDYNETTLYGNYVSDSSGHVVVADGAAHVLRLLSSGGTWSVLAGAEQQAGAVDGLGPKARFGAFTAVTKDALGNYYVLDSSSSATNPNPAQPDICLIREVTPLGAVTTVSTNLVRNGQAPTALAVGAGGSKFIIYGNSVWQLGADGQLTLIGGSESESGDEDGVGPGARFSNPGDLQVDSAGNLYLVDNQGATLRLGEYAGTPPTITAQPTSQLVSAGQSAQFSVTASGDPAPTYQWYFQGKAVAGATAAVFQIGQAQASDAGTYSAMVSNSLGTAQSNSVTLTVQAKSAVVATGGGGGGGGAPSVWLLGALAIMGALRRSLAGHLAKIRARKA